MLLNNRNARLKVATLLDESSTRYGRWVVVSIYTLIVFSAVLLTVESIPKFRTHFGVQLRVLEVTVAVLFLVEYGLRVWSAPNRTRYLFSFWGLVDAFASVPAVILLWPDLIALRVLRLFRIFRLLKLFRFGGAVARLERAFYSAKEELLVFSFLALLIIFISAVGIYHFEHIAQPGTFGSIPESLWWALATLTTVGYGDVYPVTGGGRFFTALVLLVGLGVVAIPAGIVTAALMEDRRSHGDRDEESNGEMTLEEKEKT